MEMMNRPTVRSLAAERGAWLFALYAVLVSVLEVCAYVYKGPFSILASRVWLLGGGIVLLCSLRLIWFTFKRDIEERFFWGCAAALLIAVISFGGISSLNYNLDGEGTHQITTGLRGWIQPDLAYTSCGHFCYPMRQFLLAAIPTKLLGRTVASDRLGFIWIPFLGLLLFYSGLRERLSGSNSGYLATIGVLSILTFPYALYWMRDLQQAIRPLALTAAAVGWYLVSIADVGVVAALCLSWIGAMLAGTYTPGLASWCLIVAILFLLAIAKFREGKRREALLLICATVVIVSFGACSFITRGDVQLKLYQERRGSLRDIWTQVSVAYETVFFLTTRFADQSFTSSLFLLPLDVYLLSSLWWKNGVTHFVNSVWIVGVIGTSCYLAGYAVAPPDWELEKAMVLIPPAIAGTIIVAGGVLDHASLSLRRSGALIVLLLVVYAGWNLRHTHAVVLDTRERNLMQTLDWSLIVGKKYGVINDPIDIYIVSSHTNFGVRDYVEYFFPLMQNFSTNANQCFAKFAPTRNALILYEDNACEGQLNEIRTAHEGFHELPVEHGLKGVVFIPRDSTPPAPAAGASGS